MREDARRREARLRRRRQPWKINRHGALWFATQPLRGVERDVVVATSLVSLIARLAEIQEA